MNPCAFASFAAAITTVSPIVGNEKQSEDMVNYLLQEFTVYKASDIKRLYGEDPYTAEQYYDLFMTYYNKVKGNVDQSFYDNLNKAKAALDAAKQAQAAANETAAEAAQEQPYKAPFVIFY